MTRQASKGAQSTLSEYNRKRKFDQTPEPQGKLADRSGKLRFVIQLHRATRLHFDVRLEMGGSFKSWAVPRGPSLNPADQRLAVFVEDHPIAYGSFEGIIPKGNYGAGTVMIWDYGTYEERGNSDPGLGEKAMLEGLAEGHMTFILEGQKLRGEFALIRLNPGEKDASNKTWILVKKRDEHSTYKIKRGQEPGWPGDVSAATGRTMAEIAAEAQKKGQVWIPKKTTVAPRLDMVAKSEAGKKSKTESSADRKPPRNEKPKAVLATKKADPKPKASPIPRRVALELPLLERTKKEWDEKTWQITKLSGGHRAVAEIDGSRVALYSKRFLSFKPKFPHLIDALSKIRTPMVLDGEISPDGKSFQVLDLIFFDGMDYRGLALSERLEKLSKLSIFRNDGIRLSKTFTHEEAAKTGGTFLARHRDSTYQGGVSRDWHEFELEAGEDRAVEGKKDSGERGPALTHLTKVYWKDDGYTKGDLIEYYRSVADVILPHLRDRPMSLHRFPGGIDQGGFYQKDFTGYKPKFLETTRIYSESAKKSVDYVICNNESSLLYLANLGCIEMNPWLSRVSTIENPDHLVIDLDPDRQSFEEVIEIAKTVRKVLEKLDIECWVKTSGATGLHICVPLGAKLTYDQARIFSERICAQVQLLHPKSTTLERNPAKRGGRLYLDFMQNRTGQTLASVYSVRPRPGAPVSTPLKWSEMGRGLDPSGFHMMNLLRRIEKQGDLWAPLLKPAHPDKIIKFLAESDEKSGPWEKQVPRKARKK